MGISKFIALTLLLLPLQSFAALVTPQEAMDLATATPLNYRGKFKIISSESGREACVFGNRETTIIYEYCDKEELPATSLHIIHNENGRSVKVYTEANEGNVSEVLRNIYDDNFWRLSASPKNSLLKPAMTMPEYAALLEKLNKNWGCSVMVLQPMGLVTQCNKRNLFVKLDDAAWLVEAKAFWETPTPQWYDLLKSIRASISTNLE